MRETGGTRQPRGRRIWRHSPALRRHFREVGLDVEHSAQGKHIEPLTDDELDEMVRRTTVFAKMSPLQKARVVKSLQRQGHTVGFLGDGINDAPALREADVGISVEA